MPAMKTKGGFFMPEKLQRNRPFCAVTTARPRQDRSFKPMHKNPDPTHYERKDGMGFCRSERRPRLEAVEVRSFPST